MADVTGIETKRSVADAERDLNRLYARVFATTEGQAVLRHLQLMTLDRAVYGAHRDQSAPQVDHLHAAWRDGQNQLVRGIIGRARAGMEGH